MALIGMDENEAFSFSLNGEMKHCKCNCFSSHFILNCSQLLCNKVSVSFLTSNSPAVLWV